MGKCKLLLVAWLLFFVQGRAVADVLQVGSVSARLGDMDVELPIYATHETIGLAGFQFAIEYDNTKVALTGFTLSGTVTDSLFFEPEYIDEDLRHGSSYGSFALIFELLPPIDDFALPPARDQLIVKGEFDVFPWASPGFTDIAPVDGIGDPPIALKFAPVDDPKIAAVVMFDEPHPSYYGGTVSAPVFQEMMLNALKYLEALSYNE